MTAHAGRHGAVTQPLAGVRVVNLGWIWAAPALAGAMADMGADVIKIETGRRVDNTRRSGALYKDVPLLNHSSLTLLRGQRSVTLDLANPESRGVALEIIAASDIVVENYRPGTVARWGLDYESVRRARPDVIMVSLSAGGQTGPLSKITTFGSTLSCLTGLDSIQGYFQDEPQAFGTAHIDPLNAYFGLTATLSALRHRERTGQGQYIDLGQWEATTTLFGAPMLDYQWNGRVQGTMGNRDVSMAPHGVYPTRGADAWVAIAVENESQWRAFRRALGGPAWTREPRFADMYRRLRNQDALDERIGAWTKNRDARETAMTLQRAGVPAFPVLSDAEAFDDPHYTARGGWVEVDHPFGKMMLNGVPWKIGGAPGAVRKAAPLLGGHNYDVFRELLGMSAEDTARLEEIGAIA